MKSVMNCCRCVYLLTNPKRPLSIYGSLRNRRVSYMVQFSDFHSGCYSNDGLLWGLITLFRVKSVRRAHERKRAVHRQHSIKIVDQNPQTRETQRSQIAQLENTENRDMSMDKNKDMQHAWVYEQCKSGNRVGRDNAWD